MIGSKYHCIKTVFSCSKPVVDANKQNPCNISSVTQQYLTINATFYLVVGLVGHCGQERSKSQLFSLKMFKNPQENQPAKAEQDNAVESAKPEKDETLKSTTPQDRQRRFSRLAFLIGRKVYRKGYSKGRRDGFRSGYSKGLKRGIHRGYYNGRKVGYAKGRSSGYRSGYHAGSARKYLRVLRKYLQLIREVTKEGTNMVR